MPRITDIAKQKKRSDRYSIFVDGKYTFSLTDLDFSLSKLEVGQALSEVDVAQWQKQSVESKAMAKAYQYLSYRSRTVSELTQHLSQKGFEDDATELVVERLSGLGLLDDRQFALNWIASRQTLKPSSRRKLELELRQKGVSKEVVEEVLADIAPEQEIEAIKQVAKKKLTQEKFQDQRKLLSFLLGQGFAYDQVKQALAEMDD